MMVAVMMVVMAERQSDENDKAKTHILKAPKRKQTFDVRRKKKPRRQRRFLGAVLANPFPRPGDAMQCHAFAK